MKATPILFNTEMVQAIIEGRKTQTRRVINPQPANKCYYALNGARDSALHLIVNGSPDNYCVPPTAKSKDHRVPCPYGKKGDVLWVRETFADVNDFGCPAILYRADGDRLDFMSHKEYLCNDGSLNYDHPNIKKYHYTQWIGDVESGEPHHGYKPSIHMPKWASRLTLKITDIRVERLQDISEEDAIAEGVEFDYGENPSGFIEEGFLDYSTGESHDLSARDSFKSLWQSINGKDSWDSNPWVWCISFRVIHQNVGRYMGEDRND